ncbi:MAG: hypothetical protein ACLTSX_07910 [Collinsella sp.]
MTAALRRAFQGDPEFLEVAGPHARGAAYASALADLVGDGRDVVVAAARLPRCSRGLRPPGGARNQLGMHVGRRFGRTAVGRQFAALSDVVARMKDAEEDPERAATWWPAPELADWLYSPLSGMDSIPARMFDKKIRSTDP